MFWKLHVPMEISPLCRSILAYDRAEPWIVRAQDAAISQGKTNVTFRCYDSSLDANQGKATIPAADKAFDLLICSKGPFHWMEDARRVARTGAVLLMLVPDTVPLTPWQALLPQSLHWRKEGDPNWARPAIEQRLAKGGLTIDSWWSFDLPETFVDPEQLYVWLSWGKAPDEIPELVDASATLEQIFKEYGTAEGIEIRHLRYIWKAVVADKT